VPISTALPSLIAPNKFCLHDSLSVYHLAYFNTWGKILKLPEKFITTTICKNQRCGDIVNDAHQVIKILGAGNYLMADDGVGIHILEKLERMNRSDVELVNVGVGGLAILDYMEDADDVIIIDAVRGGGGEPGSIYKFTDKELPPANLFMMSLHDLSLVDTLRLGQEIQPELMPKNITIIGIEVERVEGICTDLSPRVEAAIDAVIQLVFAEIQRLNN
jgi:hydrogenase maturation protease